MRFRIARVNLADKGRDRPTPRAMARHSVLNVRCSRLGSMKYLTSSVSLGMALVWGAFASGCSAGRAHYAYSGGTTHYTYTSSRPVVLAQAATMDCRPSDSTMTCCIKKHPQDPVGACGATQSEVDQVLRVVRAGSDADDDDYSNNASLPEWKQDCIRKYNRCQDRKWTGKCDDCLRRCEGQHEWPRDMCKPRD
jgi:hypothetical protein